MRQLKAAVFAAVLGLGLLASMAQVSVVRGWNVVATPGLTFQAGASITFPFGTVMTDTASGKVSITGTTPMVQLGGTTSSFPALKQSSTALETKFADDSGYTTHRAEVFTTTSTGAFSLNNVALIKATAPSSPASCGTSPAVSNSNGTASFVVTGGTGGTATGCTITMPAATTGWNCSINNITSSAAHRTDKATVQTASTTTSVTWEYQTVSTGAATAFTASDVFRGICFAY